MDQQIRQFTRSGGYGMSEDLLNLELILPDEAQDQAPQSGKSYDLIIIGSGPAGMTAAVYSARKQIKTLLISKTLGGQLLWTADIENYMGYQYISGRDLTDKFKEQMNQFPIVDIIAGDCVEKLVNGNGKFVATTTNGREYTGKTVIIATGKRSRLLNIKGEQELIGRGVSYCATCDAPLFKGKDVAVIGGGNSGLTSVIDLIPVANKIYLVSRDSTLQADPIIIDRAKDGDNVTMLLSHRVLEIQGEDAVTGIVLESIETQERKEFPVQGVFIEIGLLPNSEFVSKILKLNERGDIIVDCTCRTNVPGIFAAGDVTTAPEKQIGVAIGEGTKAALSAYKYLLMNK
jgi:alkyl hydroperoxide reductase subunit F